MRAATQREVLAPALNRLLFDYDFRNGGDRGVPLRSAFNEAANFVGGLYEIEATGALQSVGANIPQLSANGLEVWPSRTNQAIQNRNFTNASWTLSNVTAARSDGRDGGTNTGSRITATATNGTAMLPAASVASAAFIGSVDVKQVTGSGTLEMTIDNGATWVSLTGLSTSWSRPTGPAQTLANPQVGFRIGTSGDEFDIDYVMCENGDTVGPRIATTTVAVNRPQNRLTCLARPPLVELVKTGRYGWFWEGKIDALGSGTIFLSDNNFNFVVLSDGSITAAGLPAGSITFGAYQKLAVTRVMGGAIRACANGGAISTASTLGQHPTMTHFDVCTNGAGASARGIVRRLTFFNGLTDEKMRQLTA